MRFILPCRRSICWRWSLSFRGRCSIFVKFQEIAGARNVVFFHTKCVSKMGRVRSPKRRVRDDDFILGSCSDYPRIVFILAEAIQGCLAEILNSEFRGRRSTWWVWRVILLAPHIVNDVSYVTRIYHDIHFSWQAQYLVQLEGDSCCSAHCKWHFISDADQSWDSFCVVGAVFGEVACVTFRGRRSISWNFGR